MFFLVDSLFFRWWSRCPSIVAVGALRYCRTFLVDKLGKVARNPFFMALTHVLIEGDLHAACRNLVSFSALVFGTM